MFKSKCCNMDVKWVMSPDFLGDDPKKMKVGTCSFECEKCGKPCDADIYVSFSKKSDCHFINLTNGIQAIKDHNLTDFRFIRLQSTACEQKRWGEILLTISDDFLMAAALGRNCIVYDYGANKETPRAIWQGLEWMKYALSRRWHKTEYKPQGRAKTSGGYFAEQYATLSKGVRARMDYFKKYVDGPLQITAITSTTDKDSKSEWYAGIIKGSKEYHEKRKDG